MSIKSPLLVAHRGASGHAPENTMAAFRLALEMKVYGIELDVHMARDGSIVVIHDSTVDRTSNGRGKVGAMTLPELQSLDAGSWFNVAFPQKARPEYAGQQIPTLHEVMRLMRDRAWLYIEMKDPDLYPDSLESELLSIVRQHGMQERVIFLSFNRRALRKMRELDPAVATALLVSRPSVDPVKAALSLRANGLAVPHNLITAALAARVLRSGLRLIAWIVDKPKDVRRMVAAQVSSIISNYPDRFASPRGDAS